jgi:hypothetical protein
MSSAARRIRTLVLCRAIHGSVSQAVLFSIRQHGILVKSILTSGAFSIGSFDPIGNARLEAVFFYSGLECPKYKRTPDIVGGNATSALSVTSEQR